ncbi:MAG: protein-disulfide reductase DsbD family protein [Phycisphaerales bacterium]
MAQASWKTEPEPRARARAAGERSGRALVAGETRYVGIAYEMDAGWHTYWPGLNDTGFAITAKIEGPAGYAVGAVIYPPPERRVAPGTSSTTCTRGRCC